MKKVLLLLFVASSIFSYAQTSDAEAEAVLNLLGVQKKEAIAQLVQIKQKDSAAFWKLYDEYTKKSIATGKSRIRLYEKTAMSYNSLNSKTADSLAHLYFDNRLEKEKTLEEYYQKIKTSTNAVTAFEFYQAEVYILTMVRAHIMQQIPTYSEYKKLTGMKN
jgi:hypothetical protein